MQDEVTRNPCGPEETAPGVPTLAQGTAVEGRGGQCWEAAEGGAGPGGRRCGGAGLAPAQGVGF